MSILIKGMEMPIEKSRIIQIYPDGTVRRLDGSVFNNHFSAFPVPPHGRLIDADALVEKIDGIWDCNDMVFRPNDKICKIPEDCRGCKWVQTKDCIQRMAENAPTVIPAEEGET